MNKQRQHNDAWHWVRVQHILPVTASESRDGRCRCDGVAVDERDRRVEGATRRLGCGPPAAHGVANS